MLKLKYNTAMTIIELQDVKTKEVVAFCEFQKDKEEVIIQIKNIEVKPQYRKQGLATSLVKHLKSDFRGVEYICGYTLEDNLMFWKKQKASIIKKDNPNGTEHLYFEIPLDV